MLTVKSDDIVGRVKTYEAIVKGENIPQPGVPESFKVLIKELQALALEIQVLDDKGNEVDLEVDEDELTKIDNIDDKNTKSDEDELKELIEQTGTANIGIRTISNDEVESFEKSHIYEDEDGEYEDDDESDESED